MCCRDDSSEAAIEFRSKNSVTLPTRQSVPLRCAHSTLCRLLLIRTINHGIHGCWVERRDSARFFLFYKSVAPAFLHVSRLSHTRALGERPLHRAIFPSLPNKTKLQHTASLIHHSFFSFDLPTFAIQAISKRSTDGKQITHSSWLSHALGTA